jgi:hypothetical protein
VSAVGQTKMKGIKEKRVKWFLAHRGRWNLWPMVEENDLRFPNSSLTNQIRDACVAELKTVGLVSAKTNAFDVRIGQYIHRARARMGVFN